MFGVQPGDPEALPITCSICREPVHPSKGLLWVALTQDHIYPRTPSTRWVDWADDDSAPARWRVTHDDCNPDVGAVSYGIELYRACTPRQLALWTAHLSEKPWFVNTTWMSLLRKVGEESLIDTGIWFPPAVGDSAE